MTVISLNKYKADQSQTTDTVELLPKFQVRESVNSGSRVLQVSHIDYNQTLQLHDATDVFIQALGADQVKFISLATGYVAVFQYKNVTFKASFELVQGQFVIEITNLDDYQSIGVTSIDSSKQLSA